MFQDIHSAFSADQSVLSFSSSARVLHVSSSADTTSFWTSNRCTKRLWTLVPLGRMHTCVRVVQICHCSLAARPAHDCFERVLNLTGKRCEDCASRELYDRTSHSPPRTRPDPSLFTRTTLCLRGIWHMSVSVYHKSEFYRKKRMNESNWFLV